MNLKTGIAQIGHLTQEHWQTHQTEKNCDIAVASFVASPETFDYLAIGLAEGVLTDTYIEENDIGSGDAVFTAGLLVSHFGQTRNVPIVRTGNIAAMPEDKVDLGDKLGHQDVYLVESRSIGGLSGSPVFLQTPPWRVVHGTVKEMDGHQREYLIGVHIGLFQTKAGGDRIRTDTAEKREHFLESMSSGIGIVVPIQRAIEIIENSPMFRQHREDVMKKRVKDSGFVSTSAKPSAPPAADGVVSASIDENPNHLADFRSLVDAAARKQKQDE